MTDEKSNILKNETFKWLEPGAWRKPCIVHVTMVANSRQALFGKLSHKGQLHAMIEYVKANAERAWQRRQNPNLFRMHRRTEACGLQFTSMGNHFLLEWPDRQQVEDRRTD